MTAGEPMATCARCSRTVARVDRQGRCPRCYLREYRKARRERDPTYKAWESRARVRVSIILARDVKKRLDGVRPGGRSSLVERLLRDALECAVLAVDRDGTVLQTEGTAYAEDPRVHIGRNLHDVFSGNEPVLKGFRTALAGKRLTNEMIFRGRRWCVRWAPLRDAVGRVQEVLAVAFRLGDAEPADPDRQ